MVFHHVTGDIAVLRRGVAVNGFRFGERLEAEFAAKTVLRGAVPFKRLLAVPDIPEVGVAPLRVVEIIPVALGGIGAARPVIAFGVQFGGDFGEEFIEDFAVIFPAHLAVVPFIADPALLHFVIAAPEGDGGMMAQAADVIFRFSADIIHKRRVKSGIGGAGEHEILPDADTEFVAQVVENIILIETAAPNAQHVHVGVSGTLNQIPVIFRFEMRGECIGGDPAGAFGEERDVIDGKLEGFAPFIRFALNVECAQAYTLRDIIQKRAFLTYQVDGYRIKRLFPHTVRPPEFGFGDVQPDITQAVHKGDIAFDHRILSQGNGNRSAGRNGRLYGGQFRFNIEGDAAVFQMLLSDDDIGELHSLSCDKLDRPPDAAG